MSLVKFVVVASKQAHSSGKQIAFNHSTVYIIILSVQNNRTIVRPGEESINMLANVCKHFALKYVENRGVSLCRYSSMWKTI